MDILPFSRSRLTSLTCTRAWGPIDSFVWKVLYLKHFAKRGQSTSILWAREYAWVAELVDAKDLKSFGGSPPYRFDSGPGHQLSSGIPGVRQGACRHPESLP